MVSLKKEIKTNEEFLLKLEEQFNETVTTDPEVLEDLFSSNCKTREITIQERHEKLYQSVIRHIDLSIVSKLSSTVGEEIYSIIKQRDQIISNYSNLENITKVAPNNFDFVLSELLK